MTAKEMFEKLGYKYQNNFNCIHYFKGMRDDIDGEYYEIFVEFYLSEKTIHAPFEIKFELLQAINQQVEELGWLDER